MYGTKQSYQDRIWDGFEVRVSGKDPGGLLSGRGKHEGVGQSEIRYFLSLLGVKFSSESGKPRFDDFEGTVVLDRLQRHGGVLMIPNELA